MSNFLKLVNGIPRGSTLTTTIYEQAISVVASGAGANQINGPVTSGTAITLPNSQTYSDIDLEVYLNGDRVAYLSDYVYVSSGARTQISFTFDLVVGDYITFRIDGATGSGSSVILIGDVTGSGTSSITTTLAASGVTAATYGSATQVAQVAIDSKGRATSASNVSIAIPSSQVTNFAAAAVSAVNSQAIINALIFG